jgi:hypothetical protein
MSNSVECMRCHMQMEVGYVPELKAGWYSAQSWYPGEPEESFWKGLKMKPDKLIPIKTFRCPNCRYLESYARPENASD